MDNLKALVGLFNEVSNLHRMAEHFYSGDSDTVSEAIDNLIKQKDIFNITSPHTEEWFKLRNELTDYEIQNEYEKLVNFGKQEMNKYEIIMDFLKDKINEEIGISLYK